MKGGSQEALFSAGLGGIESETFAHYLLTNINKGLAVYS